HHIEDEGTSCNAASYEWGTSDAHSPIIVNDHLFYIRRNLHEFFQVLRLSDFEDTPIFVDAIYVNQEDTLEHNSQLRRM
ncbi:hypothetical protein P171DRAFT_318907, partial [Karstenula rhodostoma CBS 690.94]